MAARVYENIRRLDVAMNDAFGVCHVQGIGNFDGEIEQQFEFQRSASDAVFQCRAFQKFHHDEELAVVLGDFVNRADVWVIQGGSGTRFATKTF